MLAAYSPRQRELTRVEPRLAVAGALRVTTEWDTFLQAAGDADCAIVVTATPRPSLVARLRAWRLHRPRTPLVLVVPATRAVFRWLHDLPVTRLVAYDAPARELATAIREARASEFLEEIAATLESADGVPGTLRAVLALSCRSRLPMRSVKSLARAAGVHPSTLRRQLDMAAGEEARLTPKVVLEWLVVLRAVPRAVETNWQAAAGELRVDERTLRRIVGRRTGKRPGELGTSDLADLRRTFRKEVLRPLTGENAPD